MAFDAFADHSLQSKHIEQFSDSRKIFKFTKDSDVGMSPPRWTVIGNKTPLTSLCLINKDFVRGGRVVRVDLQLIISSESVLL